MYVPLLAPRFSFTQLLTECIQTGNICVYCPGGPDSDFEYSTQSYTGYEPTSMRAIRARYDPYEQARGRIQQLKALGHPVDKVEYIIMGGTFMSLAPSYRENFIAQLHNALSGYQTDNVDEAVKFSEQSQTKCVGITIGESCALEDENDWNTDAR